MCALLLKFEHGSGWLAIPAFHRKPCVGTSISPKDKTEAFLEAGTGIVLSLFSYISSAVRRIVTEAKTEIDQGKSNQRQKSDDMRGKGRGRGSGKRMGRGGRGGGRGM